MCDWRGYHTRGLVSVTKWCVDTNAQFARMTQYYGIYSMHLPTNWCISCMRIYICAHRYYLATYIDKTQYTWMIYYISYVYRYLPTSCVTNIHLVSYMVRVLAVLNVRTYTTSSSTNSSGQFRGQFVYINESQAVYRMVKDWHACQYLHS